jgi:hypothetical protein
VLSPCVGVGEGRGRVGSGSRGFGCGGWGRRPGVPRPDGVERRPGREHLRHPLLFEDRDVGLGDDAADNHEDVAPAGVGQLLDDLGHQRQVGSREEREADGVGVLLHDGLDHLLGGLVQPGVDDLEPAVAQRPGDDLGPPVVAIEPGLGHDHPIGTFHEVIRIRRAWCGRQMEPAGRGPADRGGPAAGKRAPRAPLPPVRGRDRSMCPGGGGHFVTGVCIDVRIWPA